MGPCFFLLLIYDYDNAKLGENSAIIRKVY